VKIREKEIVLWGNRDILLDVELSMLGLGLLLFLELLSLVFVLYSVAASFPKMSIETEKT